MISLPAWADTYQDQLAFIRAFDTKLGDLEEVTRIAGVYDTVVPNRAALQDAWLDRYGSLPGLHSRIQHFNPSLPGVQNVWQQMNDINAGAASSGNFIEQVKKMSSPGVVYLGGQTIQKAEAGVTTTLAVANIPAGFSHLFISGSIKSRSVSAQITAPLLRFNDSAAAAYYCHATGFTANAFSNINTAAAAIGFPFHVPGKDLQYRYTNFFSMVMNNDRKIGSVGLITMLTSIAAATITNASKQAYMYIGAWNGSNAEVNKISYIDTAFPEEGSYLQVWGVY